MPSAVIMNSCGWYAFEYGTVNILSTHKNFLSQTVLLYTVILVCHLHGDQARACVWRRRTKMQQSHLARTYRKLKRRYSLLPERSVVSWELLIVLECYLPFWHSVTCGMVLMNTVGKYSFYSGQIISLDFTSRFSHNLMTHYFFWFWSKRRNLRTVKALISHVWPLLQVQTEGIFNIMTVYNIFHCLFITEPRGRVDNTAASYSEGLLFRSRPVDQLPLPRFLVMVLTRPFPCTFFPIHYSLTMLEFHAI